MKKNILPYLCGCLLWAHSIGVQAANETYSAWDGSTQTSITPSSKVYTVHSAAELAWIAAQDNTFAGDTIVLDAHIDLQGKKWTPIGSSAKPFEGVFMGDGHLVKGLRSFAGSDGIGLFGHVGTAGKISGVGISGGNLVAKTKRRIGALAGVCAGEISQCWSMAQIAAAGDVVGGLVGELTATGAITDAYHTGLIYIAGDTIGGIVGKNAGTLTRVYNAGYAKNGKAITGYDIDGSFTDSCYYDRKLYYQESGVVNTVVTPIDETTMMFTLYANNTTWTTTTNAYPALTLFAATDASALSVAPVYVNTSSVTPVNHANDLTENFTVSTAGGITWVCQEKRSEEWIQISGSSVTVKRPCSETDVLVDATLGAEKRVVYLRPRRVEDLRPGKFDGEQDYCFDEKVKFADDVSMVEASEGWVLGSYYYQVIRFEITPTDTVVLDTLLYETSQGGYQSWFATSKVPTNKSGNFIVRSYVHDDGCITDWQENKSGFHYTVAEEFVPGTIHSGTDTLFLTTKPIYVDVLNMTLSSGGKGSIEYWWNVSVDDQDSTVIAGATAPDLSNYAITKKGKYRFTRGTRDGECYNKTDSLEKLGSYTFYVFDAFDPGEIQCEANKVFCSVEDAQAYSVQTTAASGGIEGTGYHYQWFAVSGKDTTAISGAVSQNLDLSQIALKEGSTYTFVRKAKDNYPKSTWMLSRDSLSFAIAPTFVPGKIQSGVDTLFLTTKPIYVDVLNMTLSTGGKGSIEYWWNVSVDDQDSTVIPSETDTALIHYAITKKGKYRFTRGTRDGECYNKTDSLEKLGSYTFYVFDAFDPGEIQCEANKVFCSVEDAQAYSVQTTAASGGIEGAGYHYQWFAVSGKDTTVISGAVSQNLDLSQIALKEDSTYTFVRKAKDNYPKSTWMLSRDSLSFAIAPTFVPGTIQSGVDTLFLTTKPIYVDVKSKTLSKGGVGTIRYWWNVSINNYDSTVIAGQTAPDLTNYAIVQKGQYRFTRGTRDSLCGNTLSHLEQYGSYTYYVFSAFNPGKIQGADSYLQFCTPDEAHTVTIHATAASGGVTNVGYSYQWYTVSGTDTTAIDGAVNRNLSLSDVTLQAGKNHVFVRKAKFNAPQGTWMLSANSATVYISRELNTGAIPTDTLENYCAAFDANGSENITVTIPSQTPASGEDGVEYHWYRVLGTDTLEIGNDASLNYTFTLNTIVIGTTYTYIRKANNPGCELKQSEGAVLQYYGQNTRAEETVTICASELPYTMEWYDADSVRHTHVFETAEDTWTVSDILSDYCAHDTVFSLDTLPVPSFTMDSVANLCQYNNELTLFVKQIEGISNVFHIDYSPDLAKYMGRKDTIGAIPASGIIDFTNIPAIGVGDCYMLVRAGYSEENVENICFSRNTQKVVIHARLGGYVYNKFNRVLFVDNNPENGALKTVTDHKLEFKAYQWYKNRELQEGQTAQYYHENGLELNGIYFVELIDVDGKKYHSCEIVMPEGTTAESAPQSTMVYPVPVGAGAPLTVEGSGSVEIRSLSGEYISSVAHFEEKTVIAAPHAAGIYYVRINTPEGGIEMHKLIVK